MGLFSKSLTQFKNWKIATKYRRGVPVLVGPPDETAIEPAAYVAIADHESSTVNWPGAGREWKKFWLKLS